jgi:hypothetical protein
MVQNIRSDNSPFLHNKQKSPFEPLPEENQVELGSLCLTYTQGLRSGDEIK